jgi:hypothetical protein
LQLHGLVPQDAPCLQGTIFGQLHLIVFNDVVVKQILDLIAAYGRAKLDPATGRFALNIRYSQEWF